MLRLAGKNFNNLTLSVEGQKRAAAANGKRIADLEKQVAVLETKMTRVVTILKLKSENGK